MKRILLLTVACLSSFFCFETMAQTTLVKGFLKDSLTDEAEINAIVKVYKAGDMSKPVALSTTDIDGRISQTITGKGQYTIVFSSMNKKNVTKNISLNGEESLDLGTVLIQGDAKQLQGVEVVAQKPLVKMDAEKTTYSVENDQDAKNMTLLDMLTGKITLP